MSDAAIMDLFGFLMIATAAGFWAGFLVYLARDHHNNR